MIELTRPMGPSDAPTRLAEALQQARSALGSTEQVQRLHQALGTLPELGASAAAVTATASSSSGAAAIAGKVAIMLALGGSAAWLAARGSFTRHASRSETAEASTAPAVVNEPSEQPVIEAPEPTAEPPAVSVPTVAPGKPAEARRHGARRAKATSAQARPAHTNDTAAAELELLEQAQRRVEQSPQRALSLLDEHSKRFPDGVFAQERERLAVDVLRKLGRRTAAKARAERFLTRFPDSPHGQAIQAWLREEAEAEQALDEGPR